MEWGHALVRLLERWPAVHEPVLWYPATSFGETGAASGPLAVCMAVSAVARGYAPAANAVIASSSDGSGRAAVVGERTSMGRAAS
jgi:3-oxoacyl-[acyl-carrier-protein] synthase-1